MSKKSKSGKDEGEKLGAMVSSINDAGKAGKREGVEACLRIIDAMKSTATRDEVATAIRTEMKRRTWIE